jgi:transcriptional regulator with XRE-family HTH domain
MNGTELRGLREALRFSGEELGREVGYSPMSVSRWERNLAPIPDAVADKVRALVGKHLGVRPVAPITEVFFATIEASTCGVTVRRADGTETRFQIDANQRVTISGDVVIVEARSQ